jgi:ATP-binding cassette subfamily B protein
MSIYTTFWRLLVYRPWLYLANIIAWSAVTAAELAPGLIAQRYFDHLTGERPFPYGVAGIIAVTILAALGYMLLMFAGGIIDVRHRFTMSTLLQHNLLATILRRPAAVALSGPSGEAISTFRDDVDVIENTISWLVDQVSIIVFAAIALTIMASIDLRITLLTVLPMIGVIFAARAADARLKRNRAASRAATEDVTGVLGEVFGAVQAIQVAAAEERIVAHVRDLSHARRQAAVQDQLFSQILDAIFANSAVLGTGLILVLAAESMRNATFTLGDFALFAYYLGVLSEFIAESGRFLAQFQQAAVSVQRMSDLVQSP